jgi:hypothetical protein
MKYASVSYFYWNLKLSVILEDQMSNRGLDVKINICSKSGTQRLEVDDT